MRGAVRRTRSLTGSRPLLCPGDVIDVVAPGFRGSDEHLARGLELLRGWGLRPRAPRGLFGPDLLCANSDRARYQQLRRALFAPDSRAIWCVRGGYGAIRLIPALLALDRPVHRKLLIGYSDATTLHYLLNHHWGWPSLHGPHLDRLGAGTLAPESLSELEAVLLRGTRQLTFRNLKPLNAAARRLHRVRAPLFGGNLAVLQTILGTALQRRVPQILFLEDIGERGYRVDRMLQHLLQAGALSGVKAIVFGEFIGGRESDGRELALPVIERFAREWPSPVLAGLQAGHAEHQPPLFFNTMATLMCGRRPELTVESPQP